MNQSSVTIFILVVVAFCALTGAQRGCPTAVNCANSMMGCFTNTLCPGYGNSRDPRKVCCHDSNNANRRCCQDYISPNSQAAAETTSA